MRVNSWNTETGQGCKAHTGPMTEPETRPKTINVNENGACIVLDAEDGKSFRITLTNSELAQLFQRT